jgi:glyoxylase-like metal-dependent hydrolase (beta-lactamase superfamily II)
MTVKMKFYTAILSLICSCVNAHDTVKATYLGNEAVLVTSDQSKIIFDPLYHNNFDIYQKVPQQILDDLFANKAPYDDIDAIFISHAHGDHFAADLIYRYLNSFPKTQLFAPKQAVDQVIVLDKEKKLTKQLHAIELAYQDPPKKLNVDGLKIDVVRIPHSGWPNSRTDVSNLLFRVTLDDTVTVIHMGDADPNDVHFFPYDDLWKNTPTHMSFPPYWFYMSTFGPGILENGINTIDSIGIHVPVKVPTELINSGQKYFSEPGEIYQLQHNHSVSDSIH